MLVLKLVQPKMEVEKAYLVMLTIKDIDKERNGYVTSAELDDILKLYCPDRLGNRDLTPILNKFCSI
jgi:hypothetical protein